MKIAIASEGRSLDSKVAHRLGLAPYIIIVDPDTMKYEAVENPSGPGHSGLEAVAMAIAHKVSAVLAGYCSPIAESYLRKNNIQVMTGVKGTVLEAIDEYKKMAEVAGGPSYVEDTGQAREAVLKALVRTGRQFGRMLPILVAVILVMGLFNVFVSKERLLWIFSGNTVSDTILGACFGSILPGNPINSYIIGGEMLENEVSLFAVTAFMMTWVTVGLIQLPAEISALGWKFSIVRNTASLLTSIAVSIMAVAIIRFIGG